MSPYLAGGEEGRGKTEAKVGRVRERQTGGGERYTQGGKGSQQALLAAVILSTMSCLWDRSACDRERTESDEKQQKSRDTPRKWRAARGFLRLRPFSSGRTCWAYQQRGETYKGSNCLRG